MSLPRTADDAPTPADHVVAALTSRHRAYLRALDRLRELTPASDADELAATLREAVTLVGCLRQMVKGRDAAEIHAAFGAPGDFGYETTLGAALARTYGVRS